VAAANQDSFWSMYDLLMNSKNIVDSVSAVNFAIELNLDLNQFLFDISNPQTDSLIADNNLRMMRRGLYATPTILLNGRLVPNAASNGVLEREIKRALSEVGDR
jgi:protein-disulfide isomerase